MLPPDDFNEPSETTSTDVITAAYGAVVCLLYIGQKAMFYNLVL